MFIRTRKKIKNIILRGAMGGAPNLKTIFRKIVKNLFNIFIELIILRINLFSFRFLFFQFCSGVSWSISNSPFYANASYASRYCKILNVFSIPVACSHIKVASLFAGEYFTETPGKNPS